MRKMIPPAVAAACFACGFAAARGWVSHDRKPAPGFTSQAEGGTPDQTAGKGGTRTAARERGEALAALAKTALFIPQTLEGFLAAARKGTPLMAEAVLLEALRPLGTERWAELFAVLDGKAGPPPGAEVLRRALLRLWAAVDPAGALKGLEQHGPQWGLAESEIVMREVTARGWDFSLKTMAGRHGQSAMTGWSLVAKWAQEQSPEHVADAMNHYLSQLSTVRTLDARLVTSWAAKDREAAETWLKSLTSPVVLKAAQSGFCLGLAKQGYETAENWIRTLPVESRRAELMENLDEWVIKQGLPADAARFLKQHPFTDGSLSKALVARWMKESPGDALAWASSLPADSGDRSKALLACGQNLTATAKTWEEAQAAVSALPDEASRRGSLEEALTLLPPAEALPHLDEVSGKRQAEVLRQILTGEPPLPLDQALALAPRLAAHEDPYFTPLAERVREERGDAAAMDWILSLPASEQRQAAAAELWSEWLRRDASAAWAKAGELTEPAARADAFSGLSSDWVRNDPLAATTWLAAQTPGADRDAAATGMAPEIAHTDPAGALEWVAVIGDPAMRAEVLTQIQRADSRFAPTERWRAAVAASSLSDAEKAQFLKQP